MGVPWSAVTAGFALGAGPEDEDDDEDICRTGTAVRNGPVRRVVVPNKMRGNAASVNTDRIACWVSSYGRWFGISERECR